MKTIKKQLIKNSESETTASDESDIFVNFVTIILAMMETLN